MLEVVPWRETARGARDLFGGTDASHTDAASLPYLLWAGTDGKLAVWEIAPHATPRVALRCDASALLARSPLEATQRARAIVSIAPTRAAGLPVVVVEETDHDGERGARFETYGYSLGAQCWFLAADSAQLGAASAAAARPLGAPGVLDTLEGEARRRARVSGAAGRGALALLEQSGSAGREQRRAATEARLATAEALGDADAYLRHAVAYTRVMCAGARSSRRDGKICVRGTRSRELRDQLSEFCYSLLRGSGATVVGILRLALLEQHVLPLVDEEASLSSLASELRAAVCDVKADAAASRAPHTRE